MLVSSSPVVYFSKAEQDRFILVWTKIGEIIEDRLVPQIFVMKSLNYEERQASDSLIVIELWKDERNLTKLLILRFPQFHLILSA